MSKADLRVLLACGCLLLSLSQSGRADVNVTIRGTVVAPPSCSINRGATLNVDFGDNLTVDGIDGVNYRREVPYTVTCVNHPSNSMTLKLTGTAAPFEATALTTNHRDLGIRLYINDVAWPINTAVNFTYPTLPRMDAVPVKNSRRKLQGGVFAATATLVVEMR